MDSIQRVDEMVKKNIIKYTGKTSLIQNKNIKNYININWNNIKNNVNVMH